MRSFDFFSQLIYQETLNGSGFHEIDETIPMMDSYKLDWKLVIVLEELAKEVL